MPGGDGQPSNETPANRRGELGPAAMTIGLHETDEKLRALIDARREDDPEAWTARTAPRSRGARELYQYPAMMVSSMQGNLLEVLSAHRGGRPVVYDPFVGSGTTQVEAMRLGCPFVGCDINPLAVLLCHVNSAEAAHLDVDDAVGRVFARAQTDRRRAIETGHWVTKWFRPDVAARLSALRRAIRAEADIRVRRVLWVSLAEVVRTSGNMRLSTPKLQTRPRDQLWRAIDPLSEFVEVAQANILEVRRHHAELLASRAPRCGQQLVWLTRSDTRAHQWPADCPSAGILITSPPYGDNHTTMPYGQQSFLPLGWIDVEDVDRHLDPRLLATSKTLDTHSLGGSRRIDLDEVTSVAERSVTLAALLAGLAEQREPWQRIAAFFVDLDLAFARALNRCARDAHVVVTLGDRTVARRRVPNAAILSELLHARGAVTVTSYERTIHRNKRMARRNEFGSTISSETVLILRRSEL